MNTELLQQKIKSSGVTKVFIANALEITNQGLQNKLLGKFDWWRKEIEILQEILHLNDEEVREIFFDQ